MRNTKILGILTLSILLLLQTSACSSWRTIEKHSFQPKESRPRIRVRLVDGEILETSNYYVKSDTLVLPATKTPFFKGNDRLITMNQVEEIKVHIGPKVSAPVAAAITTVIVLVLIMANSYGRALSHN